MCLNFVSNPLSQQFRTAPAKSGVQERIPGGFLQRRPLSARSKYHKAHMGFLSGSGLGVYAYTENQGLMESR